MSALPLAKPSGFFRGIGRNNPPENICSQLLDRALAGLEGDECLHILDVGIGAIDTLKFLQQYRCKVYFLDLAEGFVDDQASVHSVLGDYAGELFDICLFWDLLHRLSVDQLTVLSDALEPYLYSGSRAYTLANLAKPNEHYFIDGRDEKGPLLGKISSKKGRSAGHFATQSVTELDRYFSCLEVVDDQFYADGRLEMLFESRGRNVA